MIFPIQLKVSPPPLPQEITSPGTLQVYVINEGEGLNFTVSAADPEGDELTFWAFGLQQGAVFNAENAEAYLFSWTTAIGQAGVYEVDFRVGDGGFSVNRIVTIEVEISLPALPDIPDNIGYYPCPGEAGVDPEDICFSWPAAENVQEYHLFVYDDPGRTSTVLEVGGPTRRNTAWTAASWTQEGHITGRSLRSI